MRMPGGGLQGGRARLRMPAVVSWAVALPFSPVVKCELAPEHEPPRPPSLFVRRCVRCRWWASGLPRRRPS